MDTSDSSLFSTLKVVTQAQGFPKFSNLFVR